MAIFKLIHLLSVVVWIGGMFFAYTVLRPSAAEVLQAPERLQLWDKVFCRFFNWVWIAAFLTLVSGLYMIYQYGGVRFVPHYVHLMLLLGIVMLLVFVYVFFVQYVRFHLAVAAKDWPKAGAILATIRKLVASNLLIGTMTFCVAVLGASF
ncbi:MAG: conserved hypothetical membrane spanning [Gallionellaceae bacterium]|nr:MAG: conserved hypothetical membrane spanning [Gallionellaceae bacterium]